MIAKAKATLRFSDVDSKTKQSLVARFSLPVLEAPKSFDPAGGTQSSQFSPLPPRRSTTQDAAAIMLMSYIYPLTDSGGVEYEGYVCREANGLTFIWDRVQIGQEANANPVTLTPEHCADGGTTVAYAHAHPATEPPPYSAPLRECYTTTTGPCRNYWTDEYPSGYSSGSAYLDAHPATPQPDGSDLKLADDYFKDHAQAVYKDLTWYLVSPGYTPTGAIHAVPNGSTTFMTYKKTSQLDSKDNLYRYNSATNSWIKVNPRW
jgi:hypothetical protein